MKLFYMTDVADLIVREGFGPSDRAGFATPTARGGYVSDRPVGMAEGALGDQLLEVLFPDTLDLTDYELTGDGRLWGGREWSYPHPSSTTTRAYANWMATRPTKRGCEAG